MSDKLHTCGKCEHLMFSCSRLMTAPYCGRTQDQLIVPHFFDGEAGEVTLTRVPEFCENGNAVKSSKKATKKHHVLLKIEDIPESQIVTMD